MNSDDLTQPMPNDDERDNTTQPTMTAVFRLLREVKQDLENHSARFDALDARLDAFDSRFDAIDARFDALEVRIARDFEGLNSRMVEGFRDVSDKLEALNRSRLQTEGDYFGLRQRVSELESKAS
ncbi:MAG: hypothetical protein AABO57_26095 [Acidobacteriota bacterium]